MIAVAASLPWLLPGSVLALVVAALSGGAVARWLRVRWAIGFLVVLVAGVLLAATLSPQRDAVAMPATLTCDTSRIWLPSARDLARRFDVAVNVLMFIPLGAVLGVAPRTSGKLVAIVLAATMPLAIEAVQFFATPLGRACQTSDVVDNVSGLVIGLAVGTIAGLLVPAAWRPGSVRA